MSEPRYDSIYRSVVGFVVSYKPFYEPLLFNELNARCKGIKLSKRADTSAAFTVKSYEEVLFEIEKEPFVFLQHIHPYQCECAVLGTKQDFVCFEAMLDKVLSCLADSAFITCQCRIDASVSFEYTNQDLTRCLSEKLTKQNRLVSPTAADIAVSLTVFEKTAYLGVSRLQHNVSDWTGGVLFFAKSDDVICRAEFKLEEAFSVFGVTVCDKMTALDLGAAPGGWTHFLSKQGVRVDAVDPATLDDRLKNDGNVQHYRMLSQEFLKKYEDRRYDIIVDDMKMDTNESMDILCQMSKQLKPDGCCILTLKLPKNNVQKKINVARLVLARHFATVKIRHLYFNRSEVTVFLKGRLK